jgi:hypothetical protein
MSNGPVELRLLALQKAVSWRPETGFEEIEQEQYSAACYFSQADFRGAEKATELGNGNT